MFIGDIQKIRKNGSKKFSLFIPWEIISRSSNTDDFGEVVAHKFLVKKRGLIAHERGVTCLREI